MVLSITEKVRKLNERQKKIDGEIKRLQEVCPHPNVTQKYGSNTGNWDRGDDYYWIDWNCPDCGKRWTTEQ